MEIRPLSPDFAVSPQISVDDVAAIAADGYTHVICNRPAFESAPEDSPEAIKAAVEAAGLGWSDNPLAHGQLTMEHLEAQKVPGKVLAYCASGTRSSVIFRPWKRPATQPPGCVTRSRYLRNARSRPSVAA